MEEKSGKERHEFAWNPDFGWQILRRAPQYKKAVMEFITAAEESGDKMALDAYRIVSIDESSPKNKKVNRIDRFKTRKEQLRDQSLLFDFPKIPPDRKRIDERDKVYLIDTESEHYRKFANWFGDLILFPINPKTIKPRVRNLSSLWSLYSVKAKEVYASTYPSFFMNGNLIHLDITVNASFSHTVIAEDLANLIKAKSGGTSKIKEKPRWTDTRFQEYLNVYDAVYPDGIKTKMTYREIAEECAPSSVWNKVNSERAAIDWAKDTLKYVEKTLIPLFDRPKPKYKRSLY